MSTEAKSSETLPPVQNEDRVFDGISTDWFLQELVAYANDNEGFEIPLTLSVNGATISGTLISGKKYFRLFAEEFVKGFEEGPGKQSWYDGFANMGNTVYSDEGTIHPPNFYHMMDLRVHHPGGNLPSDVGVLWRGKVNAVSGFWLGQLIPFRSEG